MDPATQSFLVWALSFIPAPYNTYAASAIGIAGIASLIAGFIGARVKPPSSESAKWIQTVYKVITWPAQNMGWARNAVVPGMPPSVQKAAIEAAAIVAAAPEATVVAGVTADGAAVIANLASDVTKLERPA